MLSLWGQANIIWHKLVEAEANLNVSFWLATILFMFVIVFTLDWLERKRAKIKVKKRMGLIYVIGGKRGFKPKRR